jgi:predicted enzyme related to lactoylglutathione lyase
MSGEINWFELAVDDTARAKTFYGGLFGWQAESWGGEDYHPISGGPAGAIAAKDTELTVSRVYFDVDDLDAALAKIGELGGKGGEPRPIPGFGRIAHCQDDQGTAFSLFESQG